MNELVISLLGKFSATKNGQPLHRFESDNARALLAYLIAEPEPHQRAVLAAMLWPDDDEKSARNNLRQTLFKLRKTIGDSEAGQPPILLITTQTVQLNPEALLTADLITLQELLASNQPEKREQVLEIYTAPLLTEAGLATHIGFDEWLLVKREVLHQQVMAVYDELLTAAAAQNNWQKVVQLARKQLNLDPWRENTARTLMEALARQGKRSEALLVFTTIRNTLWQELSVPPMAETITLAEKIKVEELPPAASSTNQPEPTVRHNLPADLTPFIGRKDELAQITRRLTDPSHRLLTLIGIGGIGKTRLALHAARSAYHQFDNGVWLVSLAQLPQDSSPLSLDAAVADALPISPTSTKSLRQHITDFLRSRQTLLLFDNAEHLSQFPAYIANLLAEMPQVKCLVTSRYALNVPGEWLFSLPPLSLTAKNKEQADAIRLFFYHARTARPDLILSVIDEPVATRLCQLLGGHPLAIELAAGWVNVLTLHEIMTEIEAGLDILADNTAARPTRHASIHQIMAQTWRQLLLNEQKTIARLSMFRGGGDLQAVREVTGATLPTLKLLINRSLIQMESKGGQQSRYTLHELVRRFAEQQLADETAVARQAHTIYYRHLAKKILPLLPTHQYFDAFRQISLEKDNLLAAWEYTLAQADFASLEPLALVLTSYLQDTGQFETGRILFSDLLTFCQNYERRFVFMNRLASFLSFLPSNDQQKASTIALCQQAHQLAEANNDTYETAVACLQHGIVLRRSHQFAQAWQKWEAGLTHLTTTSTNFHLWLKAAILAQMAGISTFLNKLDDGWQMGQQAITAAQQCGSPTLLWTTCYVTSIIALRQNRLEEAAKLSQTSLDALQDLPLPYQRVHTLQMQGFIAYDQTNLDEAKACFEKASVINTSQLGDLAAEAANNNMLAHISFKQQEWQNAVYYAKAGLEQSRQANDQWRTGQILLSLALARYYLGQTKEAVADLKQALQLADELKEPSLQTITLLALAEWAGANRQIALAEQCIACMQAHYPLTASWTRDIAELQTRFGLNAHDTAAMNWDTLHLLLTKTLENADSI